MRALPTVAGASVDRAFPHTLVVKVAPERPVAVVRRGDAAWLATGAGKVIREIETGTQRELPAALAREAHLVHLGGTVPPGLAAGHARARRRARRRPRRRVKGVRSRTSS